jgi:hypothetical protein
MRGKNEGNKTIVVTQGGQTKRSYQPDVGLVKNREEPMVSFAEVMSLLLSPEAGSSMEMTMGFSAPC